MSGENMVWRLIEKWYRRLTRYHGYAEKSKTILDSIFIDNKLEKDISQNYE